jgi:hypothetical protein
MDQADDEDDDGVFVCMGGDQEVPRDVTHVRIHKSAKIIGRYTFRECRNLVSIEMYNTMAWKFLNTWHFMSATLSGE